jgi:endonuclease III
MKIAEKAHRIAADLDTYIPDTPIPLNHQSHFQLLIAVMLSASATDKKVNQVTPLLFSEGGTPELMAGMKVERIKAIIRDVGLANNKSKNTHKTAQLLIKRHASVVPKTFDELEALPGVGHKTASVIMSQAHGIPAFAVDTHIHRLAYRWGFSNGTSVGRTEKDLKRRFPKEKWNRLHIQMIYFGRKYCPALRHSVEDCPICCWAGIKKRLKEETKRKAPWQNKK